MKFLDEIQKNENLTILLIAHRLSTVQNADQIIVIDKGQVVEIGKHTELMKKKGFYFNLVSRNDFWNAKWVIWNDWIWYGSYPKCIFSRNSIAKQIEPDHTRYIIYRICNNIISILSWPLLEIEKRQISTQEEQSKMLKHHNQSDYNNLWRNPFYLKPFFEYLPLYLY